MNFLLFCGIPIATFLIVAAPNIIGVLYHRPEFIHTIPVVQALAPGLVFLYINSVLNTTLMSTNRERKITIMAAIALVFNLGLNLVLIPRYLHVGAAIVTSLTELLLLCISLLFIPRHLLPLGSLRVGIKALLAGLVMALTVLLLRNMNIFSIFLAALFVYLVVTALLGTIAREDLLALYSAIRHKAQQVSPDLSVVEQVTEPELPTAGETFTLSTGRRKAYQASPRKIVLRPIEQVTEPELLTPGKISSSEKNSVAPEVVQ